MNTTAPVAGRAGRGLSFAAALEHVLNLVAGPLGPETVPLAECAGRVIAGDFRAGIDRPGFDQSAMDGYAVRAADLTPGVWLPVTGRTAAGEPPGRLTPGGAHRILTGAPLPEGADTVIAQEDVIRQGEGITLAGVAETGSHIRRRGEDFPAGQVLIADGAVLDWRHVAVLAAQGAGSVAVRRRPRVALLSSGHELRTPGESLAPGQIHDSNLPMLAALLHASGAAVHPMAIVRDDAAAVRPALRRAAAAADLVLSSAGISVGDEDRIRDALRDLGGNLGVFDVAMKPGRKLAAGHLGRAVFIGLSGNPLAALTGAVTLVRPLLAQMTGAPQPATLRARAGFAASFKPGRTEFLPVRLQVREACLWAERTGPEGSARLAALPRATALAVAAPNGQVRQGAVLEVFPFVADAVQTG